MPPNEGLPERDLQKDDRLTLEEAGAKPYDWASNNSDLNKDPRPYDQVTNTGGDKTNRATDIDNNKTSELYDQANETVPVKKKPSKKKSKKKVLAGLALTGAVLAGAQAYDDTTNNQVDPVEQTEVTEATAKHIESVVQPGDNLQVLAQKSFEFNTNAVTVRTSPQMIEASESTQSAQSNEAVTPWIGKGHTITVLHALVSEDLSNPANGNWYGFMDTEDGIIYWINAKELANTNVEVNTGKSLQQVNVQDTTTAGIIGIDKAGNEMTVGTAITV